MDYVYFYGHGQSNCQLASEYYRRCATVQVMPGYHYLAILRFSAVRMKDSGFVISNPYLTSDCHQPEIFSNLLKCSKSGSWSWQFISLFKMLVNDSLLHGLRMWVCRFPIRSDNLNWSTCIPSGSCIDLKKRQSVLSFHKRMSVYRAYHIKLIQGE